MMKTSNRVIADQLGSLVERLHEAPERVRPMIVNEIMALMLPHFRAWAPQFCRKNGDTTYRHREDLTSVAAERVLEVLNESLLPGKHENVENWYSYLYGVTSYAVLAYFNSSDVTVAAGMTSLMRRQRLVARTREELRGKLGREPEPQEIIDAHNAKMRTRRSNPEKQGALVELADLENILPVADIQDHDRAIGQDDEVIAPVEAKQLIETVIDSCFKISPHLGQTAEVWLGNAYAQPPYIGDEKDVAQTVQVTRRKATEMLTQVRDIAQDIANRVYGVNLPV
jgi:hypothetical protein